MSEVTVVLYHGPGCQDGFGAAFAAWSVLGDQATYIPVQYGQEPPSPAFLADRLYILDFSYDRMTILEMARRCIGQVVVLDHHKSAREILEGISAPNITVVFDMDKSGAVLAWEHFHPGKPVPMLLQYVQDRDLWKWELPSSHEFSAALSIEEKDFEEWDNLERRLYEPIEFNRFIDSGESILAAQRHHVEFLASKAFIAPVGDYLVPVVNSSLFQSEIGQRLCQLHPEMPFAAVFFVTETEEIWSLRSRNGFDVSSVAKSLGGGGHAAAAGFKRPRK